MRRILKINAEYIADISQAMRQMLGSISIGNAEQGMILDVGLCANLPTYCDEDTCDYFENVILNNASFPFESPAEYFEATNLYLNPKRLEFMQMASDTARLKEYIKALHNIP